MPAVRRRSLGPCFRGGYGEAGRWGYGKEAMDRARTSATCDRAGGTPAIKARSLAPRLRGGDGEAGRWGYGTVKSGPGIGDLRSQISDLRFEI